MHILQGLQLTPLQWLLATICGLLVGFSKTGVSNVSTLAIPIMASLFGGKNSAAILLPMLIIGDFIAIRQYWNHANWSYIRRLLPWTIAGLIIGLAVGNMLNDHQFKMLIGICVFVFLGIMLWMEFWAKKAVIPNKWWFIALIGLAGGFTTMIGNASGPVMTIYLLSMRLPKYDFIGTGAWFYMILNLTKLPLQIIFWQAISLTTLKFDLTMIPAIILGAVLGVWVIKILPEKSFRLVVIVLTAIAAARLFGN